jgi:hypothetical protein
MEIPSGDTNEPNNYYVEYTGPDKDDRDPRPLSETVPETFEEIKRRSQPEESELLVARRKAVDLQDAKVRGEEVDAAELQSAWEEVTRLEAQARQPESEDPRP